ncbi:hypothetical protein G7Y79_00068g096140 [Physcia stellaris]|nr:hypothetical protein G7Y79_00068g096140 [Physcia stellaris]
MSSDNELRAELHGEEPPAEAVSLWSLLSQAAHQHPHNSAVISLHQSEAQLIPGKLSYIELFEKSEILAACLESFVDVSEHSIMTFLHNQVEFALLFWTSARLGYTFVPLDPQSVGRPEVDHMLTTVKPSIIVTADAHLAATLVKTTSALLRDVPLKVAIRNGNESLPLSWQSFQVVFSKLSRVPTRDPTPKHASDVVLILFTSGTTAAPKACPHTSKTLCLPALAYRSLRHINEDKCSAQHLPSHHSLGMTVTLAFWLAGACVMYPSRTFDALSTLDAIKRHRCTHMAAVPSMIHALRSHSSFDSCMLGSLLSIDLAGTTIESETLRACLDPNQFGAKSASTHFGMTESAFSIGWDNADIPENQEISSSVGRPIPGAKVAICEPGSKTPLKRGQVGELHLGGHQVISGYIGVEDDMIYEKPGSQELWIATGDRAVIDAVGVVHVLGRYKDMIVRGGVNISPFSIESSFERVAGVTARVVAVPDEVAGEVPVAIVQKTEACSISNDDLRQAVHSELGPTLSPVKVLDMTSDLGLERFPTTTSGKIRKVELQERVTSFLAEQQSTAKSIADGSYLDISIRAWSQITGYAEDSLPLDESIHTFADSIMILQFTALIKRELGISLGLEDFDNKATIRGQAQLLSQNTASPQDQSSPVMNRDGPPETEDMAHTCGDPEVTAETRNLMKPILAEMNLNWDQHVEDVIPLPDINMFLGQRLRPQSFNHRQAFSVPKASSTELKEALKRSLVHYSTLRSLIISYKDNLQLFVVIRPGNHWDALTVTENLDVEKPEDLCLLLRDNMEYDFAAVPGPLFKLLIADVKSTGGSGFAFLGQHATFDALSISLWLQDLDAILLGHSPPSDRGNYKDFADTYFLHRSGHAAQAACDFHYRRLRDLGRSQKAFWPAHRAPGWFRGHEIDWKHLDGTPGRPEERPILDGEDACGQTGILRTIHLPSFNQHRADVGVPSVIFTKAACALMNIHFTGAEEAVFVGFEAGRSWPFVEDHSADSPLPFTHPMDIPGPTVELVLSKITVHKRDSVSNLVRRMYEEQQELTRYAHAPIYRLRSMLASEHIPRDIDGGDVLDSLFRRQCFNWLPGTKSRVGKNLKRVEQVQMEFRSDIGLQWFCGFQDDETIFIDAKWDNAQLRKREVEQALDVFVDALRWVTSADNWDKSLAECGFI